MPFYIRSMLCFIGWIMVTEYEKMDKHKNLRGIGPRSSGHYRTRCEHTGLVRRQVLGESQCL